MLNQSPSLICIAHVVKGVKKRLRFRVMKRVKRGIWRMGRTLPRSHANWRTRMMKRMMQIRWA